MAVDKLLIPPSSSTYTMQDGSETASVQLAGGASRYRKVVSNAASYLECEWVVGPTDYTYLRAFYNTSTKQGSLPFLIDLVIDLPELTEHNAFFVVDTFQLKSVVGLTYTVGARLEVTPTRPSVTDDALFLLTYNTTYTETDIDALLDALDDFVNTDMDVLAA